jgi:hypothetical protein
MRSVGCLLALLICVVFWTLVIALLVVILS